MHSYQRSTGEQLQTLLIICDNVCLGADKAHSNLTRTVDIIQRIDREHFIGDDETTCPVDAVPYKNSMMIEVTKLIIIIIMDNSLKSSTSLLIISLYKM